ncbi:serine hydrolase domain-containing protein [Marinobacter sp. BSs20148]|uniref:serine hydrolase domain-containing protein n=1 Tax=Marinobacter sp. BSs20148 TaxID=490759 RepID=UPI0002776B4B|nr:serine hydrolase domain-containing protein [Marinobacter sp. BSs20148]AFP29822.1 Putative fimbrial assembly protein fimD, serogroup D [Marinobacter sp. BSs20148]
MVINRNNAQKKSRSKDFFLIFALVTLVTGISHFVITNPLGPSRLFYYIEAPLIQWSTRCSSGAPDWLSGLQRFATRNMGAPASQLAFITPEGQLHHCETGWKDSIFGDKPLQPDTRFRFASTTKTVSAIAVIDLINQGALSLDDKIVDILSLTDNLKDSKVGDITVGHLLSHRAGWDRRLTQDAMFMMDVKPWCPYSPETLTQTSLLTAPGEAEAYSNAGYCLLGLAIEKATGEPFREYMSEHFAFPASSLAFIDGPYMVDEVVYDTRNENFYTKNYFKNFDFNALSSSAGLSGSASDLAILVKKSLENGPLTILDGDMNNTCDPSVIQECYGFGVYRYQLTPETMPLFIHGGKLPGATSAVIVDPRGGVLVWLGAGAIRPGSSSLQEFYDYIREDLVRYYQ